MTKQTDIREVDTRDCIRVVTSNDFLKIEGLCNLKLNSLKLLYLAIAQVQMNDDKFYTCKISTPELAKLWGVSRQRVHKCYDEIITELHNFSTTLRKFNASGDSREYLVHIISMIIKDLDKKKNLTSLEIEIDHNANDLFLKLENNFSQPLLCDFNKMKSVNSILIWHLIQIKTKSKKPVNKKIELELSDIELRKITGKLEKYSNNYEFKRRVLDKAIKDIEKCCFVKINCKSIKSGRYIIGYKLILTNAYAISKDKLSNKSKKAIERAKKINKSKKVTL